MRRTKVVVCGNGNVAHILAGLAASDPEFEVRVLLRNADKAQQWSSRLETDPLVVTLREPDGPRVIARASNFMVTRDPESACRGCAMVILVVPAFAHGHYLASLAPYLDDGVVIVGFPGQNGFIFEAREVLRRRPFTIIDFESCPWSCRIIDFGREARILGAKQKVVCAVEGDPSLCKVPHPIQLLQRLIGPATAIVESRSMLAVTLMSINAYCHPPIMYAKWKDWNREPLAAAPLFYHSISRATADLLTQVSDEGQAIGQGIQARFPGVDLSEFVGTLEWDLSRYRHLIQVPTDLYSVTHSNQAYADILHPTKVVSGGHVPDFEHRFLSEDVPYGLVPIRGIAELAGVKTPKIDEVLRWSQAQLGKSYLVGHHLTGPDLCNTRAPQRFGYRRLEDIL